MQTYPNPSRHLASFLTLLADDDHFSPMEAADLIRAASALDQKDAALRALAEECRRHASHPISDHRGYFECMGARASAALAVQS